MYLLAHEAILRSELGLPAVPTLWGKSSTCIWKDDPAGAALCATAVAHSPEWACGRRGFAGAARLTLVDELLVHSWFAAARDLALYLAVSAVTDPTTHALATSLFLRLKATQASLEGASYQQARSLLLQIEALFPAAGTGNVQTLLEANTKILWGRLHQLLELPHAAD